MFNDEKIRVLIAHGNPLVAAGLEAAFGAREDFQLIERCVPAAVLESIARLDPADIAVTDYDAGTRVMHAHRGRGRRVLIVTDIDSEVSVRRAVELGAGGYLPLFSPVETVVRAARCISTGGTAIDSIFISKIAVSLASPGLTSRELEVLRLMIEGLPNKAIACTLRRSVGTAKSHVRAILSKLDATTRVEAVAVARRRGLVPEQTAAVSGSAAPTRNARESDRLR